MNRIRRILMAAALFLIALLVALSACGAFLGAEKAGKLFNSLPLAAFWLVFAALLIIAPFAFARIRHRWDLMAIHLGGALVLIGGAWGSQAGFALREKLFDLKEIRRGVMSIDVGSTENRLWPEQKSSPPLALPFALRLDRFYLEYYPPKQAAWTFHCAADTESEGLKSETIRPVLGEPLRLPFTDVELELLAYVSDDDSQPRPALLISTDTETTIVPIEPGKSIPLAPAGTRATVGRTFRNLRLVEEGEEVRTVDAPGPESNPALQLAIEFPDGAKSIVYIFPPALTTRMPHRPVGDALLMYLPPRTERHGLIAPPTIKLRLTRGEATLVGWLAAGEHAQYDRLGLIGVYPDEQAWRKAGAPEIILARPAQAIRDYKSDLVVVDDNEEVARKTIEVNRPLHYGGYHFYHAKYDSADHRYTIMTAVSDRGLWATWLGFALLAGGITWSCWIRPGLSRNTKRTPG